jgi:hypothetical protein
MRLTTRLFTLALTGALLAACASKDKNAPLAFAPADTPYVLANIDTLDSNTRKALLVQADAQLPSQLARLNAMADRMQEHDPDGARLLHALATEFKGKTVESFAQEAGIALEGHFALYGIGLAPVARLTLDDPKAFDAFVAKLESAYGKPLAVRQEGQQSYRTQTFASSGTQLVIATQGKQAVLALLPVDAAKPLLRQALGLDRPAKSVQDSDRLAKLAKAKDYQKYLVGQVDMTRLLPLLLGGDDPLLHAVRVARAEATKAKTGEPVANQLRTGPTCVAEAQRIAAREPSASFGYTTLTATRQDARLDIALAADISKAFAGLQVALPGLGGHGADAAPFDVALALPIAALRDFWSTQVDAVAAKPFACPELTDLNDSFATLGQWLQKSAIPPFGDLQGIGLALDSMQQDKDGGMPKMSGRLLVASNNPAGLLAMGQMTVPSLTRVKPVAGGPPQALPQDLATIIGQPAWLALTDKVLALGVGAGEDAKLAQALKAPVGEPGRMARMHLSGAMYLQWLQLMDQQADKLASAAALLNKNSEPAGSTSSADAASIAADVAQSKAQLAAMQLQAARIADINAEMHVEKDGIVLTSATTMK